jgi:hypothetical protein
MLTHLSETEVAHQVPEVFAANQSLIRRTSAADILFSGDRLELVLGSRANLRVAHDNSRAGIPP